MLVTVTMHPVRQVVTRGPSNEEHLALLEERIDTFFGPSSLPNP